MRSPVRVVLLATLLAVVLTVVPLGFAAPADARVTFNLGASPSAVVSAMGQPSRRSVASFDSQVSYFGSSWVKFTDGVVNEYVNAGNLAVSLGSKSAKTFYIWLGCHRTTAIASLGTPTSVTRATSTGAIWGYGKSSITIRNNKVAGWTDKGELRSHFKPVVTKTSSKAPTASSTMSPGTPLYDWFIQQPSQQVEDVTVYITRTGRKYHRYGCQYLRLSCISIARSSAISLGYGQCSVCSPP